MNLNWYNLEPYNIFPLGKNGGKEKKKILVKVLFIYKTKLLN